ncbi:unnamed protein product, partial [Rotaria sp. Silwood1]
MKAREKWGLLMLN